MAPNSCGSNGAGQCGVAATLDFNADKRPDFIERYTCDTCDSKHYLGLGAP